MQNNAWVWGIAQILPYNPPGTSASWYLIFSRAGSFQAFWLVILHGLFVVALIFPYSHCLQMSWFEVTSCLKVQPLVQCLCTPLSDCWKLGFALRQKHSHSSSTKTCTSHTHHWKIWLCWALIEEKADPVPAGSSARSSIFHRCPMSSSVCRSICAAEISPRYRQGVGEYVYK